MTSIITQILANYHDNYGVKTNLHRILTHGALSGTGKIVILPVDQGFEHGPVRSFAKNPDAYDPAYHYKLAIKAKLSAFAAPIGLLEANIDQYYGQIPLILKLNNSHSMSNNLIADQAITASVKDAVRLGCCAVGFTIYPGSEAASSMFEEAREIISEAKSYGLPTVMWSYPRGGSLIKEYESAVDICAYAAHIAALLGAHIIKVKLPNNKVQNIETTELYKSQNVKIADLHERIVHVKQSAFNGKRMIIFSGGTTKSEDELLNEIRAIKIGGGNGSIIGRNAFQRSYNESISLLQKITDIYAN